ncbi:MAG: hypothetical protein IKH19_03555 [Muribaculaceae bacterium]|nr:hypothetical protein [Muribaculaceae bacterium]
MKKVILFVACASMMASSAMAQMSLVKDVAKLAASSKVEELQSALDKIQPAFTNPETANDAQTWFLAGKAAFGLYDKLFANKSLGQQVDAALMEKALTQGFEYLQKALPLDSVKETNKDGSFKLDKDGTPKIKTKFSKDIIPLLTGHITDIAQIGNDALGAENWATAASAFGKYADIASSPFAKAQGIQVADSIMGQVRFFQGYSQYNLKDFLNAYNSFNMARKLGYTENNIVDFATSSLANHVQSFIDKQDYAGANAFVDNALSGEQNNATLWDIKGFVTELVTGINDALPFYKKSTELDANYANGFFDAGRCLYLQANQIIEDNPSATNAQLKDKLVPIYSEALPYLEKAVALDANNIKAQQVIDDIKYKLELMGVK